MFKFLRKLFASSKAIVKVVKPLGHENLIQFTERIVKELSEGKYENFVVIDFGEEIRLVADVYSTADTILKKYEREFIEGYSERYERFEAKIAQFQKVKEIA